MDPVQTPACAPWWRHAHVWLVIAGPAVVVVAGIATLVLALRMPDPLVTQGAQVSPSARQAPSKALLPAMQGRNHAASPAPSR